MEYINNILTGFSIKINETDGDFKGVLRAGQCHKKETEFCGNINTLTDHEKFRIEGILVDAFPGLDQKFCDAYKRLLPNFNGFIVIVNV